MSSFRRTGLLAAAVLALVLTTTAPAEAGSRRPMCKGKRATIVGTPGNDKLKGTGEADVIVGRGGADRIIARGGRDIVCGGRGADRIDAGRSFDHVYGGSGADRLEGSGARDRLYGGPGADVLIDGPASTGLDYTDWLDGGRGADLLYAGSGSDFLTPGPGRDRVFGGDDNHRDVVTYRSSKRAVVVDLGRRLATGEGRDVLNGIERVDGSDLNDVLRGTETHDTLAGNEGDDEIYGLGGNDQLNVWCHKPGMVSGAGDDSLFGGDGHDDLYPCGGDDLVDGGTGWDRVSFSDASGPVRVDLSEGVATGSGTDALASVEGIYGSEHADVLIGDDGPNAFEGGAAADHIDGAGGNDIVIGDQGFYGPAPLYDQTGCLGPYDWRPELEAPDSLHGGADDDLLIGCGGDDTMSGDAGDDTLLGGAGDDLFDGGAGSDWASFDDIFRNDPPFEGVNADLESGMASGYGQDVLVAIENLRGSNAIDWLAGDDGVNHLEGDGFDDQLMGRGGDDILDGGEARPLHAEDHDRLDGGPGIDSCLNGEELVNCE